jgi:type II secretory pathway pseudopilin PulG
MNSINHKLNPTQQNPAARSRRGSLMVEMVVCTILLSVVSAVLVPGIFAVHQQRKATRYETFALLELNNLAAMTNQQEPTTLKLSSWFTDRYSEAKLKIDEVTVPDAEPSAKHPPIRLTIIKATPEGLPNVEHSLTIWPATPNDTAEAAE